MSTQDLHTLGLQTEKMRNMCNQTLPLAKRNGGVQGTRPARQGHKSLCVDHQPGHSCSPSSCGLESHDASRGCTLGKRTSLAKTCACLAVRATTCAATESYTRANQGNWQRCKLERRVHGHVESRHCIARESFAARQEKLARCVPLGMISGRNLVSTLRYRNAIERSALSLSCRQLLFHPKNDLGPPQPSPAIR